MSRMIERHYTVRFLTPAFLGNAEQSGQWRTPPFKALLRQWWRVAVAADCKFDVDEMRRREAELFGTVEGAARKSLVRIRLDDWKPGKDTSAPAIGRITLGANNLDAALYSGYGPVIAERRLKATAAIQHGDAAALRIAHPADSALDTALGLIHRFGAVGGRSRNGWGSLELRESPSIARLPLQDWRTAIGRDWPHCIGKDDGGPLLWESKPWPRWEDAMRLLAQTRADMRRKVNDRLLLAFPSTRGSMPGWKNTDRVPHSLRFKVRSEGPQFVALIVHLPCRPADELWRRLPTSKQDDLPDCFAQAHRFLDAHPQLSRPTA